MVIFCKLDEFIRFLGIPLSPYATDVGSHELSIGKQRIAVRLGRRRTK